MNKPTYFKAMRDILVLDWGMKQYYQHGNAFVLLGYSLAYLLLELVLLFVRILFIVTLPLSAWIVLLISTKQYEAYLKWEKECAEGKHW